jgi:hypothetical protein
MPESLPTLDTIAEWLNEEYNAYLSTYVYDDHVRLTNGSAAYYVNISVNDDNSFTLNGERYGDEITKSCDATREALITTLAQTI